MSTSVIAEGTTEQNAWQDEGQECNVSVTVANCGGKSKDRKVSTGWGRRVKHWIWLRPGRTEAARAERTVEGRATIDKVRGHGKGRERAG